MLFSNIPPELLALPNWVGYRNEERNGKQTKVPYQCKNPQQKASAISAATWCDSDGAIASADIFDGIGFVFSRGYTGIDLDNCFCDGVLSVEARKIVDDISSYTEISPSGKGIHIIAGGMIPGASGRRVKGIEIYSRQRFFTMTGNVFEGRNELNQRQEGIAQLWHKLRPEEPQGTQPAIPAQQNNTEIPDDFDRRVFAWMQDNDYMQKIWEKAITLESQSDYDLQISIEALRAGFSDKECMRLIELHRTKHKDNPIKARRKDYIQSTLRAARSIASAPAPLNVVQLQKAADPFVDATTISHAPAPMRWLIRRYLPQAGIVWLAGEWSTFKTFLALDMAFHIATGRQWCDQPVHEGKVIYIAGEGFSGLGKRLKGLELHHGALLSADRLLFTPMAVMLNEQKAFVEFSRTLKTHHPDPVLIVIDTKSANMTGSDSDPAIMNTWINNIRHLEKTFNCLVLVIDHVGHMTKDRPRGVSQQMGAADAVYMVERNKELNQIVLRTEKDPKDFEAPPLQTFKPEIVDLPSEWSEEGITASTLVMKRVQITAFTAPAANTDLMKPSQHKALAVLRKLYTEAASNRLAQGMDPALATVELRSWKAACLAANIGLTKSGVHQMAQPLINRGQITVEGHWVYLVEGALE